MNTTSADRVVPLPEGTAAPRAARRAVHETLEAWGLPELEDEIALLVSELTTNALLHAGGVTELRLRRLGRGVRVEVCDPTRLLPQRRNYDEEATTGRGLTLVSALATRSGVEATEDGKCIWFEIDRSRTASEPEALQGSETPGSVPTKRVRLLSLPVAMYCASQQQIDALLREFAIEAWDETTSTDAGSVAAADQAHGIVVARLSPETDAATDEGREAIDAEIEVPADLVDEVERLLAMLDDAEHRAAAGELLARPTLPELRAVRHWYLNEIASQLRGDIPSRWTGARLERAAANQLPPVSVDWEALGVDVAEAVVAGDEGNRIVAVTTPAAELLGWDRDTLVGERIAAIVPERLREQHLAGFSQFLATGERHIIGRTIVVPALRGDGSEVEISLHLETRALRKGRTVFLAWLACSQDPTAD